jgi:hypothetical protein
MVDKLNYIIFQWFEIINTLYISDLLFRNPICASDSIV